MSLLTRMPDMQGERAKRRSKGSLLFELLLHDRMEFRDRLLTFAELRLHRFQRRSSDEALAIPELIARLGYSLGIGVAPFLQEEALGQIEACVREGQRRLGSTAAFETYHDAPFSLARLCYVVCRALRPETVMETGVGYGVTSAFILRALAENAQGMLWSVDLPPLAECADNQSGYLVPSELRSRWRLIRGRTRRVLPKVMAEISKLDIFLHDSLHTYRNMMWEFTTAWETLRGDGVLISDDVGMSRAFCDFAKQARPALALIGHETGDNRNMGIMVKAP